MPDDPPAAPVKLLILGTRPYSEVLIDLFECLSDRVQFTGAVENRDPQRCGERLAGLPIHWQDDIAPLAVDHRLICALGTTLRRDWIEACKAMGFGFETLTHPSSTVSRRTVLGEGVIVDAGCVVAGFSTLHDHVRVGRRCSIGHHTQIGPFTTLHPGVIISGNCRIGAQVTLGTGSIVIDGIEVGDGAVAAAGTVITRNIPAGALVAGNPCRTVRPDYGPI